MARYLVTTRRSERNSAPSARDAVAGQQGVTVLNSDDPHMVAIDTSDEDAAQLREKLKDTHFVEPEIRRSLQ
jgi:hypothetical protein